jgi:hypothetical protein
MIHVVLCDDLGDYLTFYLGLSSFKGILLEFIYHSQILSVSGRLAHDKGGFIRLTHLFDLLFFILHMTTQDSCVLRRRWLDLLVVLQSRLKLILTPMRK